ncbi:MAG: cysteine--tRNA ligase [Candidatus Woesearchaeota archaeon]
MLLYNTLTRRKEAFTPIGEVVGLYTCGPTVYNHVHIGNLRAYLFEDLLKRVLIRCGYRVKHVMNITDVGHLTSDEDHGEDKMERGARREGKSVWEIAHAYTDAFMRDIAALNILEPDVWCRATDHISEQIEQIRTLTERGHTYETSDGVYFDTSTIDDYGKLAGLEHVQLRAGARVTMGEKRTPTDFALWKYSPKDETRQMEWIYDGPRSGMLITEDVRATLTPEEERTRGFPGWHIECSAMSMKYLGERFDIHCGGIDHINVHHTNEIAQAESATGTKPWVNVWMHSAFLTIKDEKMAKSGENFITLEVLEDRGYHPLDYRYFTSTAHYRQDLNLTYEALDAARAGRHSLMTKLLDLEHKDPSGSDDTTAYEERFEAAIRDDLNAPQALAVLWEVVRDETLSGAARLAFAQQSEDLLALGIMPHDETIPESILALVDERESARAGKDYARADELRDAIAREGYVVEDGPDGVRVRRR